MFGFARLAGYDYFGHVERALRLRLSDAGAQSVVEIIPTPPTASIRRRARVAMHMIAEHHADQGPIHLIGHSTGGLDARLLASPSARVDAYVHPEEQISSWHPRLASVTTINTPHYGTPLAQFFATVSGTRLLYALSLLTITTLTVGGPSLTAASSLVAALGKLDDALGLDIKLFDRVTEMLMRFLGERERGEVHEWLNGVRQDQGGIIQITPEAMDLFAAAAENSEHVRYGCIATAAPTPRSAKFLLSPRGPYAALSATIYSTLHTVTSRPHAQYPYPEPTAETRTKLNRALGQPPDARTCDGIVPTLSMLWGTLLWAGPGDHLDVVGHFRDRSPHTTHTDWLASRAPYDAGHFAKSMDAIARFILDAS